MAKYAQSILHPKAIITFDTSASLQRAVLERGTYQMLTKTTTASTHASPSPDGHYIAGLTPDHLYVYYTATLTIACSFPLDSANTPTTRSTETPTLHWTPCSLSVVLQTSSLVSLYSLANTASRVKLANGSASLGRIASVDVFGENVVVVWEFGRVGIFEVGRGRVTELCDLKTGLGNLKSAWGIRRVKGKAEGIFYFYLLMSLEGVADEEQYLPCYLVIRQRMRYP
jgi:hypothetical protein